MGAMPPGLLPRIHPFWLTLGYGIFVGYEIRKHDIDGIIKRKLAARRDEAIKHQASIMLDMVEDRKLAVSTSYTADVNNGTKG